MNLITRDAERLLLEKANSIASHPQNWRCIYINFSTQKEQYSEGLRSHVVTNIIKDMLEGDDGYIYLCEDGDVFIIFRGQVTPIIEKLGEQIRDLGKQNGTPHPEEDIYSVLDLSKFWTVFYTLCKNKAAQVAPALKAVPAAKTVQTQLPEMDADIFRGAVATQSTRSRPLVLVVEDDPFTRRLIGTSLKTEYDLLEAPDGNTALQLYQTHAPDAVFLDIELPDTNGHVLLKKFLTFDRHAFVVMLSANSKKENVIAALEQGAQGFVTKPFAKEKLLHYLRLCTQAKQKNVGARA